MVEGDVCRPVFPPSSGHYQLRHDIPSTYVCVLFFAYVIAACIESLSICVCPVFKHINYLGDRRDVVLGSLFDSMEEGSCQILIPVLPTSAVSENRLSFKHEMKGWNCTIQPASSRTFNSFYSCIILHVARYHTKIPEVTMWGWLGCKPSVHK